MHYLKTSLTGEAGALLKNLAVTEQNYASAWETLKTRYENRRVIITSHVHSIVALSNMTTESSKDLKIIRDTTTEALTALKSMGRPVDTWDDLLVYLLVHKFDSSTRKEWETALGADTDSPALKTLMTFLDTRIRVLDSIQPIKKRPAPGNTNPRNKSTVQAHASTNAPRKCLLCSEAHALYQCQQFKALSVEQRQSIAREHRCCFNCLHPGHSPKKCPSKYSCAICRRKHHTLIHGDSNAQSQSRDGSATPSTSAPQTTDNESLTTNLATHQASSTLLRSDSILLATAWVLLQGPKGNNLRVRALLDQGSERTFVTEAVVQSLRATRQKIQASISGIGGQPLGVVTSTASLSMEPCHGRGPRIQFKGLILPKLTSYRPRQCPRDRSLTHFQNLELADPNPASSAPIGLLLGADLYGSVLKGGLQRGDLGAPLAQETIFGWVISGPTATTENQTSSTLAVHRCTILDDLDQALRRFWELEELPRQVHLTEAEEQCERHFRDTHSRGNDGRYTVRLPFKDGPPIRIGGSLARATTMLTKLERRLDRDRGLHGEYHAFLQEYLDSGHMKPIQPMEAAQHGDTVYIPHLPVVRASSSTTRVRVVFNASSPTSDGTSLNDHLHIGPKLQNDLPSIILRWRMLQYAFTADVQQMYRQIRIDPRDAHHQCILWRKHSRDPVDAFQLMTVTYGTASAPYQALRVMKQLALDEGDRFPLGASVLSRDCYVDDVIFGAETPEAALQTRDQLIQLLASGGFHLRKWATSDPDLLQGIPPADRESGIEHALEENHHVKVLGLIWIPESDCFRFQAKLERPTTATKREILSVIARLFDPLGWLAPVVVSAKILLQELWIRGSDWDTELPAELQQRWLEYCQQLASVSELRVSRWTGYNSESLAVEIHGFADASQRAYAAVVYLRILDSPLTAKVKLLMAKTKVSPIKEVSIPRLELCAVVLLSKLIAFIRETLDMAHAPVYGWTDSTVVLAWLSRHPSHWKTFVANRVTEVLSQLPQASWRHVPTSSNPADCASRGLPVGDLLSHDLWWRGPEWLAQHSASWPLLTSTIASEVDLEQRTQATAHVASREEPGWDLHLAISSWPRLLRVTAYCRRFVDAIRTRTVRYTSIALIATEISHARLFWIRFAQTEAFSREMDAIQRHRRLPGNALAKLNPFFDKDGIMRVGGRLKNSSLPFDEKHPVILPRHRVSELIVAQAHIRALHGGPQLTLRVVRQNYWIVGARDLVKSHIHRCVPCVRERAVVPTQLMADLPKSRTTPSRPFSHCGVDYAGPVQVRTTKGRGHKSHKAYIAVFVCFATRAIHLELVSDYTSSAFMAALRRFVARRGLPSHMYSDNGTTFQGAEREIRQAFQRLTRDHDLANQLSSDGIIWKFLPPLAPHFGGLWESGVKGVKHHLRRIVGAHTLTFEELTTLLYQIEACLNSRPIAPMTNDPGDSAALTPGHFLIGSPLCSIPEPSTLDMAENRLSRYQLIRRMYEQFWRQWSSDYLNSLQQRNKWSSVKPDVRVDDLVLLRNDNMPPSKWQMARVVACHPGPDNRIRVVTVKTADSVFKRPITKLCTLPVRAAASSTT